MSFNTDSIKYILDNTDNIKVRLEYNAPLTWMYKGDELLGAVEARCLDISKALISCLDSACTMLDFDYETGETILPEPLTEEEVNEMLENFALQLEIELGSRYNVTYMPFKTTDA